MENVAQLRTVPSSIPGILERLRRSYDSGRTRSRDFRDEQLSRLARLLVERESELLEALHQDLGKSHFEGWIAELGMIRKEIAHTRKHLERWMRPRRVATPLVLQPGRSHVEREPLGVVLVIAPWNYPVQLSLGPLLAALAAGNCVVLKPSEIAAHTSDVLARLVPQYLDPGVVAVVQGGVPETTALLEQRFDHIFYTGNGQVGRVVMTAAAKHLTPVTLELGGKSPVIVDATADVEVSARRIVWAKFFNAGQTCVAPDYVLADRRIANRLCNALAATVREFYGDDPRTSKDYARIINTRHHKRLTALLADGKVVCGGQHDEADRYIAPTVLREVDASAPIMADEIFGPILPVLEVGGVDEAVRFVNARPKPLALYVFSENRSVSAKILSRTSSGGACVNDAVVHLAVPDLPFGGVGESGMGAYHGKAGFETFTHRKAVLTKSTSLDVPLRYPPYDETKQLLVKGLM